MSELINLLAFGAAVTAGWVILLAACVIRYACLRRKPKKERR